MGGIISDAMSTSESEMDSFMSYIRAAGFSGCPICRNNEDFSWGHSIEIIGKGPVRIEGWIPGSTTLPGDESGATRPFMTPLRILICDRCSHVMTFSKTHLKFKASRNSDE